METDIKKDAVIRKVMDNLGINDVPCEVTDSIKDKILILTDDEKARLLNGMDKETVLKVKNAIDSIQRYSHG